jgi:hypothetical protein
MAWLRQAESQGDEFARTLVDFYTGKFEARAIEAVQLCHQQSLAALDDGMAAADSVAAAVQARCTDAIDTWVRTRFRRLPALSCTACARARSMPSAAMWPPSCWHCGRRAERASEAALDWPR